MTRAMVYESLPGAEELLNRTLGWILYNINVLGEMAAYGIFDIYFANSLWVIVRTLEGLEVVANDLQSQRHSWSSNMMCSCRQPVTESGRMQMDGRGCGSLARWDAEPPRQRVAWIGTNNVQ